MWKKKNQNYYDDYISLDSFSYYDELFKNYNTICIWLGLYPVIVSQDPEFIEKVLSSPDLLNKAKTFYVPANKFFDGGIIASSGKYYYHVLFEIFLNQLFITADKWVHNRKLINPCFNHKVLLSFFPIFNKAKRLSVLKFDALVDKGEHKLHDTLQRLSLGTSFGKESVGYFDKLQE